MTGSLNFEIEADELEIFIQDVNEHLQAIEAGVLRLEQGTVRSVAGQAADLDTLNAVFRAAHTLKAIAATVGHRPMAELTHNMETFFDMLRAGRASLTQAVTDELLVAVDTLKALRDEVISLDPSGVDVAALLVRLHTLVEEAAPDEKNASHATLETVAKDQPEQESRLRLTPEQVAQAWDYAQKEHVLLEVEVTVQAGAFAPAARLLQAVMALAEVGQIVAQHPTQADLASEQHQGHLWLILATQSDQKAVEELLDDVVDLDVVRVQPYVINPRLDSSSAETARRVGDEKKRGSPSPGLPRYGEDKTVRISVERLDSLMNLVGELVTDRTRLLQISATLGARYGKGEIIGGLSEMSSHFSRVVDQLQGEVLQVRMLPLAHLFSKFPRLVRDVAREANKQVSLVVEGEATELDRSIIEAISDPLAHLLRNGVDHGIESPQERVAAGKPPTGSLWLTAAHEEGHIVITVQDDGQGIDPARARRAAVSRGMLSEQEAVQLDDDQAITLIFQPGVSTAERVTSVSGRGVGLDVVHTNVKQLGGAVTVESEIGRGTTFRITLPLTLAILQTMLVALGDGVYAIPLTGIVESLYLSDVSVESIKGKPVIYRRKQALPLLSLREFFAHSHLVAAPPNGTRQAVVTVAWGKLQVGLIVDALIGKQEIVVKSLSPIIGNVAGLSGCTILGDGCIALIVDVPGLINAAMRDRRGLAT